MSRSETPAAQCYRLAEGLRLMRAPKRDARILDEAAGALESLARFIETVDDAPVATLRGRSLDRWVEKARARG